MAKTNYCLLCHKEIAKPGTIHIAGTICQGHTLWDLIKYKIVRGIGKYLTVLTKL